MKKPFLLVMSLTVLLTGCSTTRMGQDGYQPISRWFSSGYNPFFIAFTKPAPQYPNVWVENDAYIVVDQDPIYIQQGDNNSIFWALDSTKPYYFPNTTSEKGIEFDNPKPVGLNCGPQANTADKVFVCTYKKSNKKKYPYTIKVTKDGSNILKSDPSVMND